MFNEIKRLNEELEERLMNLSKEIEGADAKPAFAGFIYETTNRIHKEITIPCKGKPSDDLIIEGIDRKGEIMKVLSSIYNEVNANLFHIHPDLLEIRSTIMDIKKILLAIESALIKVRGLRLRRLQVMVYTLATSGSAYKIMSQCIQMDINIKSVTQEQLAFLTGLNQSSVSRAMEDIEEAITRFDFEELEGNEDYIKYYKGGNKNE